MKIKNIIFDIGGVIINLNYLKTLEAIQALGASNLDKSIYETPLFTDYEQGLISSAEFRDGVRQTLKIHATDKQLDEAWNAMLLDLPSDRLELIRRLSTKYRTFILSNTNEIHKTAFELQIQQVSPFKSLDEITEKAYYSHQVHDRKPNPSIFKMILEENDLVPAETLYLEDTLVHIQTAKSLGINTVQILAPLTMEEVLKDF